MASPVPAAASPMTHVAEEVAVPVAQEKPVLTEESNTVNPEATVIESAPKCTQEPSSILNSDESKESRVPPASNGNLLFDHNVLQGIPTLDPVSVKSSESSAAPPLTQSDSLAAVIADLNKTLSQAPVPVTSSGTPIPGKTFWRQADQNINFRVHWSIIFLPIQLGRSRFRFRRN
jgi:hypothetical protein